MPYIDAFSMRYKPILNKLVRKSDRMDSSFCFIMQMYVDTNYRYILSPFNQNVGFIFQLSAEHAHVLCDTLVQLSLAYFYRS